MKHNSAPVIILIICLFTARIAIGATTYNWNAAEGDWMEANNWLPATGVPGAGDSVRIRNNGTATLTNQTLTVSSLWLARPDSGTTGNSGGLIVNGTSHLTADIGRWGEDTLSESNNISISVRDSANLTLGADTWFLRGNNLLLDLTTSGTTTFQGRTELASNTTLNLSNGTFLHTGTHFDIFRHNDGSATTSAINLSSGGEMLIRSDFGFRLQSDATLNLTITDDAALEVGTSAVARNMNFSNSTATMNLNIVGSEVKMHSYGTIDFRNTDFLATFTADATGFSEVTAGGIIYFDGNNSKLVIDRGFLHDQVLGDVVLFRSNGSIVGTFSNIELIGMTGTLLYNQLLGDGTRGIILQNAYAIPEPSSLVLLTIAGLCLMRRRRRAG